MEGAGGPQIEQTDRQQADRAETDRRTEPLGRLVIQDSHCVNPWDGYISTLHTHTSALPPTDIFPLLLPSMIRKKIKLSHLADGFGLAFFIFILLFLSSFATVQPNRPWRSCGYRARKPRNLPSNSEHNKP